ncbi:hypothetical protein ABOM_008046 [Aspergillus bombycis]|uniref:protein S-acyltransferase n=1 Tax=Aspergillus bombycis TaxID=109264 RepID=A0A1F7ZVN4_9EURO|nr:hypothetical protein ABOM_008046 [Aspergillus bombycis]OGM43542.1 hypothetical protein ABOM_008046 [Aspergillus bombycis]
MEDINTMDILDPVDRRRAQNRLAQRRFRSKSPPVVAALGHRSSTDKILLHEERCQQRLRQSVAIQTEGASASESCSSCTSGDTAPHYLTLQSDILPDATKEPEHSLFSDHIDTFLIPEHIFPPTPEHTHLSDTLPSSSSGDGDSGDPLVGVEAQPDTVNHSVDHTGSTGVPRAASLPTAASWKSPLHVAAQEGYGGIVQLLLEHNADCNEKDSDGLTPLAHAIRGDHEAAVRLLLSHGARLDYTDGPGCSVFHCAVIHRREALLRLFANHCAANLALLDALDVEGMTPLHRAVVTNFEAGVRILLHHGASVHHRAQNGR